MSNKPRLPNELRKLLAALSYEDKLRKFRYANEREPASEEELQAFIVRVARELYNHGMDQWPEDQDEELA